MGNWAGSALLQAPPSGWSERWGHCPNPQPLCSQELKGLDLEDICMVPPSVAGWRQPRGSGPRRWVPGSEGAGWHLGPSGPGMERGHQESTGDWALRESPPDAPPPPQRSWRHQVTGWPGGGLQRSDSGGMVDKTDGTGRKGRPPPRGRGCRGTVPAPTRPWDLAVERTAEGGPGPNRRVGRRKGRGAGCPPGCGNRTIPAPGQQNARGRMKWRQGQRKG